MGRGLQENCKTGEVVVAEADPATPWAKQAGDGAVCGWCRISAWVEQETASIPLGPSVSFELARWTCPRCVHLNLSGVVLVEGGSGSPLGGVRSRLPTPEERARHDLSNLRLGRIVRIPPARFADLPEQAPGQVGPLYREAAAVLGASPRASAALARRCLEEVLREQGFTKGTLFDRLSALEDSPKANATLSKFLHGVREFGNLAAHGAKNPEVPDVEPGEAEWCLEVIRELVDYFYARPVRERNKLEAVNARLVAAGGKPIPVDDGEGEG